MLCLKYWWENDAAIGSDRIVLNAALLKLFNKSLVMKGY